MKKLRLSTAQHGFGRSIDTQTEGFAYNLNGPYYFGAVESVLSDENLLDSCSQLLRFRIEFLQMLKYSATTPVQTPSQLLNGPSGMLSQKNLLLQEPHSSRSLSYRCENGYKQEFQHVEETAHCITSNHQISQKRKFKDFLTRKVVGRASLSERSGNVESRASGVPTRTGGTPLYLLKTKVHPNSKKKGANTKIPLATRRPGFGSPLGVGQNLKAAEPSSCSRVEGGMGGITGLETHTNTPGRPRMNRADFACKICETRSTPQWRYLDLQPVCNACYMRARKMQRITGNCSTRGGIGGIGFESAEGRARSGSITGNQEVNARSLGDSRDAGVASQRTSPAASRTPLESPHDHGSPDSSVSSNKVVSCRGGTSVSVTKEDEYACGHTSGAFSKASPRDLVINEPASEMLNVIHVMPSSWKEHDPTENIRSLASMKSKETEEYLLHPQVEGIQKADKEEKDQTLNTHSKVTGIECLGSAAPSTYKNMECLPGSSQEECGFWKGAKMFEDATMKRLVQSRLGQPKLSTTPLSWSDEEP